VKHCTKHTHSDQRFEGLSEDHLEAICLHCDHCELCDGESDPASHAHGKCVSVKIRITHEAPKAKTCANPSCDSVALGWNALVNDAGETITVEVCESCSYRWTACLGVWPVGDEECDCDTEVDERPETGAFRVAQLSGWAMIHKGDYYGQYMGGSEAGARAHMRNLRQHG